MPVAYFLEKEYVMNDRERTSSVRPARERVRERKATEGGAAVLAKSPMLTLVVLFGLVFLLFMGLRGCTSRDPVETGSTAETGSTLQTEPGGSSDTPAFSTDEPSEQSSEATEDSFTTEPSTEAPTTEPPGPVMMTVDDRYFDDALFLGDSRTDGLYLYSTPGSCKHYPYPATSMTIVGIMDSKDKENRYGCATLKALLQKEQFGKIYLMFGINEAGYNTNTWAEKYKEVVEQIRSYQPNAIIYIQSVLYVTQKHEQKYPVFATAGLKEKNARIKELANGVDIFYLEVNDCLNDGTDHLPSEYTSDGAHLKAKYYRLWHDYLLEHAVVDAAHPWEPLPETTSESTESTQP